MNTKIEFHNIGSIGNDSGKLDVSYMPDHNLVSIRASVPADKRRSEILVQVVGTHSLRRLIEQLELVEAQVKQQRTALQKPEDSQGGMTFYVMNTRLFIPNEVLAQAERLISRGDSQALAKEIRVFFPMLTVSAANELAHLIYIHFRPRA